MENDNDENVGGDDTNMLSQPSYPDYFSYFMIDDMYFMTFICLCFVIE